MAELTFKSPGVSTKEIDLSGPTAIVPTGVPAGIIGTADQGPAFVPVTVATFGDFQTYFGKTDGEKFGPLAMYEWMKNAKAGTYLRVLGIGDGKKRLTSAGSTSNSQNIPAGGVKNAGFIAGAQQVKANGYLGNNAYAYAGAQGGALGRTFLLGCFMSESNGCTLLSTAGIQSTTATAATTTIVGTAALGAETGTDFILTNADGDAITFTTNATKNFGDTVTEVASPFTINTGGSFASDGIRKATQALWISCKAAIDAGILDCTISPTTVDPIASGQEYFVLTQTTAGTTGNTAITLITGVTANGETSFAGGGFPSQPILRGVLMAPSGVLLALSGNWTVNATTASAAVTKGTFTKGNDGGGSVGSITCGGSTPATDYNFVMLLNGHKNTEQYPNTLTASLNPGKSNYISNVFNTDATKIEDAGHLLYTYYNIETQQAVITGSAITTATTRKGDMEEAVFLLTSSMGRNPNDDSSTAIPSFENFSDRFQHAFSPMVVSQKIGGKNKDLFTVHSLDDGSFTNTNIKISIENIKKAKLDGEYGGFDLIVRSFWDTDSQPSVIETGESFRGLNLDPDSDDYIGRRIGNTNTYFDFDKLPAAQKIVVDGVFANKSRYIRVKMNSDVAAAELDVSALPVGFRGPYHLVTSGSSIMALPPHPLAATEAGAGSAGSVIASSSAWSRKLRELPIPYRLNIGEGSGTKKTPNSSFYWGWQNTRVDSVSAPNSSQILNKGLGGFTTYYPKFLTTRQSWWVGANAGTLDSDGTVYDSDKFNNNLFTLENIQIHTKSTSDIVDPKEWAFANYRRDGTLVRQDKSDETADTGRFLNVKKDFGSIASQKYFKFTFPVQGGFQGTNLFNEDKAKLLDNACKREMDDENQGATLAPTISAYAKALDVMAEKSDVDIQLLTIPGLREEKLTDIGIEKTEERFDAMYIMDIEETDVDNNVVTSSIQQISVANTVETLKSRALDTSFAAVYFPDTFIQDPNTLTNVRVPPSVVVLGAMALNDAVAYPWFAPAGFTRGALGSVIDTKVNFNRNNLDTLYETDINPITEFPTNPGKHVIWGQKTLMAKSSALDRVNVRRLLIDVRRKVRRIADTFIFEPNRESTLARFSAAVDPVLAEVQAQQGVDRYKVIIDSSTTTQADVENNTVRGKIFMQPTRAVEFIALDFVVTNNGTEI